jgi:hypothetical protein
MTQAGAFQNSRCSRLSMLRDSSVMIAHIIVYAWNKPIFLASFLFLYNTEDESKI